MANIISGSLNVAPGDAQIPEDNQELNPLDTANNQTSNEDSELIKTLVSGGSNDENLLEVAPEVDRSLLEDIVPPTSIALILLKGLFVVLAIVSVAILVLSNLLLASPNRLDFINQRLKITNMGQELTNKNQEVISLQTDVNLYRFLQAKSYFDEFSYYGDSYIQNYELAKSPTVSDVEKTQSAAEMTTLRGNLRDAFLGARDQLMQPITSQLADSGRGDTVQLLTQFKDVTVQKLQAEATKYAGKDDPAAKTAFKNYTYAINLVGNTQLAQILRDVDFDKLNDEQLYWLVRGIDYMVVNDISTIQKIKDFRIRWSDIISEIDNRTRIADEHYTKENYDQYGGIRYTSYSFDQDSNTVSIVGETKKFDTKTFTNITNLIDAINGSTIFGNAEMRSFSKSGDAETGYISSLKLSFNLKPIAVLQNILPDSLLKTINTAQTAQAAAQKQ